VDVSWLLALSKREREGDEEDGDDEYGEGMGIGFLQAESRERGERKIRVKRGGLQVT